MQWYAWSSNCRKAGRLLTVVDLGTTAQFGIWYKTEASVHLAQSKLYPRSMQSRRPMAGLLHCSIYRR